MKTATIKFQFLNGQNWETVSTSDHMIEELTTWAIEAKPEKYELYDASNGCTYRLAEHGI